jgi:hypothetical protein
MILKRLAVGAICLLPAASASASVAVDPATAPVASSASIPMPAPVPLAETLTIPIFTPVVLQIDSAVSSKTARRGDKFSLTMISDLVVDGAVVVPLGTKGEGEVVHSAGVGFGGRAGELILAARFLQVGDAHLPLQSFRISKAGANNTAEAIGVAAAAGVVGAVAAMFITGTSAEVAAGQIAVAKTAAVFSLSHPKSIPVSTEGSTTR